MFRTFGTSVLLAIGIAIVLSYLPTVDMTHSTNGVAVFNSERPTKLSESNLVDFLSLFRPHFPYRHVEFDEQKRRLAVDFLAREQPTEEAIKTDWLTFVQQVFLKTKNVQVLTCRLYDPNGNLIATLTADRNTENKAIRFHTFERR